MQRWVGVMVLGVVGFAGPAGAADTRAFQCQGAKNQLAGKYAACLAKAEGKLVNVVGSCSVTVATACYATGDCPTGESCTKDLAVYQAGVSKCGAKFTAKWEALTQNAADASDPCPDGMPAAELQALIDAHSARIASRLAGNEEATDTCGNRALDAGEECDLGTLSLDTCVTRGFTAGELRCGADCRYDTSGCYTERFVDNHDGTIRDHVTGLMWEKKIRFDSQADESDPHDADNPYPWSGLCGGHPDRLCQPDASSAAACQAGADADPTGCSLCAVGTGTCQAGTTGTVWQWLVALNASQFGGYSDWRVPTRWELETIGEWTTSSAPRVVPAFHGSGCDADCNDLTDPACSCTASSFDRTKAYWTSSAYVQDGDPAAAWLIEFYDARVSQNVKSHNLYGVRAVRGGM